MKLSIPRVLLAFVAAGVVFLLVPDDEPVAPKQAKVQERITQPAITHFPKLRQHGVQSGQNSQVPDFSPTYSSEVERPSYARNNWNSRSSEYRFRPLDENRNTTSRYQSDTQQLQPKRPTFTHDSLGYEYPNYPAQGLQRSPNQMLERFRPLDEKQQSKRWHGSYKRMSVSPEQLVAPERSVRSARFVVRD